MILLRLFDASPNDNDLGSYNQFDAILSKAGARHLFQFPVDETTKEVIHMALRGFVE